MTYKLKSSLTIFVFVLTIKSAHIQTQGVPTSPCPRIFQYRFDGSEWFGLLSLRNPDIGLPLHLKVALSLRGKPMTNYLGEIELLTRGQLPEASLIKYKVKFPKNRIPPKLVEVVVNDGTVCMGATDQSIFVTQIQLEHTRKFTFLPHDSAVATTTPLPSPTTTRKPFAKELKNPSQVSSEICGRPDDRIERDDFFDIFPRQSEPRSLKPPPLPSLSSEDGSIMRGEWPWMAAVYVNNLTSLSYQCGGTLISSRVVLSSAHCFHVLGKRFSSNEVLVFLGRFNLRNWNEEGSVAAPVDEMYVHPEFDSRLKSYDADVAILILKSDVDFNQFIRPACLWTTSTELEFVEGERGTVVGWGRTYNSGALMITPRQMEATIVSQAKCFKADDKFRAMSSNRTFCAGDWLGDGPCSGDSGSGLMLQHNNRWKLRGIVAAALPSAKREDSCSAKELVVYADVAQFLDWIFAFII